MVEKYNVGYSPEDFKKSYGKYYDEAFVELAPQLHYALENTTFPAGALPSFYEAKYLQEEGYTDLETGHTNESDGSIHAAIKTAMPGVTPAMWEWWFGWHGSQASRYKLWHPKSHVSAVWEDGSDDTSYIGRNSVVKEFIVDEYSEGLIQFKQPTEFGFSYDAIKDPKKAVYICARIGHSKFPIDYGYLVHQVRAVEGGSEMRSRFWLGGQYIQIRKEGVLANLASSFIQKMKFLSSGFGNKIVIHCSEEMNHLASFLPKLFAEMNQTIKKLNIEGRVIERTDEDFESVVLGTLFNKIDPGKRPIKVVEVKSIQDVIETIKYAKSHGKKVSVCSGGYSFSANHIRDNSILIMMKNFNQFKLNVNEKTATVGPGVSASELMLELYEQNLFFPASHCKGVCIGGYLLQGGYGWNGRKLGIACQSVIGIDLITADGEYLYASESENADFFWAALGGGGGFFGVVVRFHLKVYQLPKYRAIIAHQFYMKHLEDVYSWAYEVGPSIPKAVEFQMIMSNKMSGLFGPGIEAAAPIFADTKDEFEEAIAFMKNSPIKRKALIAKSAFDPGINALYKSVMTHFPQNHHYGVDNMWTHSPLEDLMPFIKEIARTLPPPPSHMLWLNWHPGQIKSNMAYSEEDNIYIALYTIWKNAGDTSKYGDWAAMMMGKMNHLSTGIQLADEGLHKRTAPFLSGDNLKKMGQIRSDRDPKGLFHEWHSRPEIKLLIK